MKLKILSALAAMTLLSGCASNWDVDAASSMAPAGDAFSRALQKNYAERARFEKGEQDWCSVKYFTDRAVMAAEGKPAPLQLVAERSRGTGTAEIVAAHAHLTTMLATSAPKDAPEACAAAQAALEHWMEQQEEGHQADHIAMARADFEKAAPDCKPAPVAVALPGPYTVYFDFDSSAITPAARKTLSDVVVAFKSAMPGSVVVTGHTDTAGDNAYNDRLANKRAAMVADELTKMGIAATALSVSSYGKTQVAVDTGDNVMEGKNRRVEIHFMK